MKRWKSALIPTASLTLGSMTAGCGPGVPSVAECEEKVEYINWVYEDRLNQYTDGDYETRLADNQAFLNKCSEEHRINYLVIRVAAEREEQEQAARAAAEEQAALLDSECARLYTIIKSVLDPSYSAKASVAEAEFTELDCIHHWSPPFSSPATTVDPIDKLNDRIDELEDQVDELMND